MLPVHVILVNYKRVADTIECVESLLRSDYPELRIIIVDNNSADDSLERLQRWATGEEPYASPATAPAAMRSLSWPPVPKPVDHAVWPARGPGVADALPRVLIISNTTNEGFAGANNRAMRLLLNAGCVGYACLINNDMVVASGTIRAMIKAIEGSDRIAAMGAVMLEYQEPDRVQMVGGSKLSTFGTSKPFGAGLKRGSVPHDYDIGYVSGGALLTRISTLRDIGLLDEDFFLYAEDRDWGVRMLKGGYRLQYAADAEIWHKGSITVGTGSTFQDYHVVRAQLQFVRKHTPMLVPLVLGYSFARSLAPKMLRGQWRRAVAVLRAYVDFLRPDTKRDRSPSNVGAVHPSRASSP